MKNKILFVIGFAFCSLSLQCVAQGVVLNNEYGCQNPDDQHARAALITRLQSFSPQNLGRQNSDKDSLKSLNESKCQALNGQFTLLQETDGLRQVESTAGKFWLLE